MIMDQTAFAGVEGEERPMWTADRWKEYESLDCGGGERLERWGKQILIRPDPQAIWRRGGHPLWKKPDAIYHRSDKGGGSWQIFHLPASWQIHYDDLTFQVKPMNFKHTGLFPEQAANWDFIRQMVASRVAYQPCNVLNLFAYTGGATLAAAAGGASVCHVDASKGMVAWAKENAKLSGLAEAPIRYIVDDCKKFIEREIRRGRRYDAIIMDPPSYGRGPSGEVWKFEESIAPFLELCMGVLSEDPLFLIINSYTTGISPSVPVYLLGMTMARRYGGTVEGGELLLPVTQSGLGLPCGHTTRWICQ